MRLQKISSMNIVDTEGVVTIKSHSGSSARGFGGEIQRGDEKIRFYAEDIGGAERAAVEVTFIACRPDPLDGELKLLISEFVDLTVYRERSHSEMLRHHIEFII